MYIGVNSTHSAIPTSRGGRMSRVPAFHSGSSGNLKSTGLSLEPVGLKPGRLKLKTLKLILVAF